MNLPGIFFSTLKRSAFLFPDFHEFLLFSHCLLRIANLLFPASALRSCKAFPNVCIYCLYLCAYVLKHYV